MDTLFVKALKVDTHIGIYAWEREISQSILIDLEIAADAATAAQTDSVDATINYQAVCDRLVAHVGNSSRELVETLAEEIAQIILTEFGAPWVEVTLHKPAAVRGSADVGVRIRRQRPA